MIYSASCFNLVGLGALFGSVSPQNPPLGDGLILHRPDEYIRFTPSCPPHILQQNCTHATGQHKIWLRNKHVYSFQQRHAC